MSFVAWIFLLSLVVLVHGDGVHLDHMDVGNENSRSDSTSDNLHRYENACLKTYELYLLTLKGGSECSISKTERINCLSLSTRQNDQVNNVNSCTSCTKLGCCFDKMAVGTNIPYCYKSETLSTARLAVPTTKRTAGLPIKHPWNPLQSSFGTGNKFRYPAIPSNAQPWKQQFGIKQFQTPRPVMNSNSQSNSIFGNLPNLHLLRNIFQSPQGTNTVKHGAPLGPINSGMRIPHGSPNSILSNGVKTGKVTNLQDLLKLLLKSSHRNVMQSNLQNGLGSIANQGGRGMNDYKGNTFGAGVGNNLPKFGRNPVNTLNPYSGFRHTNGIPSFGQSQQKNPLSYLIPQTPNTANIAPGVGMHLPGVPSLGDLLQNNIVKNLYQTPATTNKGGGIMEKLREIMFPTYSQIKTAQEKQPPGFARKVEKTAPDNYRKKVPKNFVTFYHENSTEYLPAKTCYPDYCGEVADIPRARIVGGQPSRSIHYWPWTASFRRNFSDDWNFNHVCGAALISQSWILTAGHCFTFYRSKMEKVTGRAETDMTYFAVWFGTYFKTGVELTSQIGLLEKFVAHPNYDFDGLEFDIAVAKLKEKVFISDYVRPVCLPPKKLSLSVSDTVWITGWGSTMNVRHEDERELKELPLPLISFNDCRSYWTTYQSKDWICTKGSFLEDACTGDSGGPLVHQGIENNWRIVGVAIAGTKMCSTERHDIKPGIYTNVAYYRDFIDTETNGAC